MATLTALAMLVTVASVDGAGVTPAAATATPALEEAPEAAPEPDVVPARDWIDDVMDCLAWAESRNDPNAYNRRSGASGLLQFLPSTWRSTPWAGSSIWDPSAQRAAGRWMILNGRGREWSTWGYCV